MIAMSFFIFWIFIAVIAMSFPIVSIPLMFIYVLWTRRWLAKTLSVLSLVIALFSPMYCAMALSVLFVVAYMINNPVVAGVTASQGIAYHIKRLLDK